MASRLTIEQRVDARVADEVARLAPQIVEAARRQVITMMMRPGRML